MTNPKTIQTGLSASAFIAPKDQPISTEFLFSSAQESQIEEDKNVTGSTIKEQFRTER